MGVQTTKSSAPVVHPRPLLIQLIREDSFAHRGVYRKLSKTAPLFPPFSSIKPSSRTLIHLPTFLLLLSSSFPSSPKTILVFLLFFALGMHLAFAGNHSISLRFCFLLCLFLSWFVGSFWVSFCLISENPIVYIFLLWDCLVWLWFLTWTAYLERTQFPKSLFFRGIWHLFISFSDLLPIWGKPCWKI